MDTKLLQMCDIDKRFAGVHALTDVHFDLQAGEIHALVGENGAGKSTLMNVLVGAVQSDQGQILIDGQETSITSPNNAIRNGIGIVPQELNIVPEISVAENIFMGMPIVKNGRINWKQTEQSSEEILAKLGCHLNVREKAKKFNTAELQMVQIARALVFGAKIIILDEPTASLTYRETQSLFAIMRRLKEQGMGVIFITHHLEEVMEISDRVTVMRDGRVIGTVPKDEITIKQMISMMAGQDVVFKRLERHFTGTEVHLKVENLSKQGLYKDISFEVRKGEVFGIGGLVGSGRSEVVSAIFGAIPADSGTIYLKGEKIAPQHPQEAIAYGIGYVPEERRQQAIFPDLSIRENLTVTLLKSLAKRGKINGAKQREITQRYIDMFQIKTTTGEKKIKELSGGNQQKVILSRWMETPLQILILDEPTRGIDVKTKEEIHNIIKQIADSGMTIIAISSEMDELINISDRIMVMKDGQVKGICEAENVTAKTILNIALG